MKTILNLNDLLQPETNFELNNKVFTLNTSMKSFIQFVDWNEKVQNKKPDEITLDNQTNLIKIIVKESDIFLNEFNDLNVKNQVIVLQKIVELWNNEINNTVSQNESAKKF